MKNALYNCFLIAVLAASISCSKTDNDNPGNKGKYAGGFFVLNGGYDTSFLGIDFYSYDKDSLFPSVYKKENPGHIFGGSNARLSFGTIYKNRLFLVASGKGYLVVVNPLTLKETGRIRNTAALDPNVFLGINEDEGLLSCNDGIYKVSLFKPELGTKIAGVDGFVGEMVKAGGYIFALTKEYGIVVLKESNYGIVKKIPANSGLAVSKDGNVWAIGGPQAFRSKYFLLRIDPATLHVDTIPAPIEMYYNVPGYTTYFYTFMTASTKENVLYLAAVGGLYRYVIGDPTSLNTPIFSNANGEFFRGNVVNYNAQKNQLVLLINAGWSAEKGDKNKMYICDATTGAILKTILHEGYYLPSMVVFN